MLAGQRSEGTLEFYTAKAAHLVRLLGANRKLASVDAAPVDEYIATRFAEGASKSTIGKELTALSQILKAAARRGEYDKDLRAVMPIGFSVDYQPKDTWLPRPDLEKLMGELPKRRRAAVAFMVATSAEWGAVERAERADIDLDAGEILVRGTKNQKRWRTVPILGMFEDLIELVLDGAPSEGLLFNEWGSVRRDLALACERAEVQRVSPNDLRRSTAKWLRNAGVEPQLIASMMGHADSRMVERVYGRLSPNALGKLIATATGRPNSDHPIVTDGNNDQSFRIENPRVGGSTPSPGTAFPG